jgi:hypothetical protein
MQENSSGAEGLIIHMVFSFTDNLPFEPLTQAEGVHMAFHNVTGNVGASKSLMQVEGVD